MTDLQHWRACPPPWTRTRAGRSVCPCDSVREFLGSGATYGVGKCLLACFNQSQRSQDRRGTHQSLSPPVWPPLARAGGEVVPTAGDRHDDDRPPSVRASTEADNPTGDIFMLTGTISSHNSTLPCAWLVEPPWACHTPRSYGWPCRHVGLRGRPKCRVRRFILGEKA